MSEKEENRDEIYFSWSGLHIPLDKAVIKDLNYFIETKIKKIIEAPEFEDLICRSMVWYSERVRKEMYEVIRRCVSDAISYGDFTITVKPTSNEKSE